MNKIGSGTYGVVYKTWDNLLKEPVAIKKFKAERTDREFNGAVLPGLKEIAILLELKRTSHSNIVNLREVLEIGADCFMVLDYQDWDLYRLMYQYAERERAMQQMRAARCNATNGKPCQVVQTRLVENLGLPPALYQSLAMQLLEAVKHCHSLSIVHRDIKPANILVSNSGILKLADFGMARSLSHRNRTLNLSVVTLPYRSPELLMNAPTYSTAVDNWSVGCVIAELITGYHMFLGDCEIHQLFLIFERLGTPKNSNWPGVEQLPNYNVAFPRFCPRGFLEFNIPKCALDLIKTLLRLDPAKRATAAWALKHELFYDACVRPLALFMNES